MSKSRKILGALLAVFMVLSVLSISAFAVELTGYEEDASRTQSWSLGTPVPLGGNQYKVDVILSTNYEVGPVSFKLEGVTSVDNVAVGAGYYAGALTDKSNDGRVFMVPDTTDTVPAKSCNGTAIATVTYTTNNANGAVTIAKDVKHAKNPDGTLVAARCTAGTVNASSFIAGQTTTVSGELVFEVSSEPTPPPATATLTGVNGGFVDEANRYVYGVPAETANPATYFSTTGYVELVDNSDDDKYGTGDSLNLYTDSSKGTLVKSYTIVIFGDVDGDGAVGLPDAGIIQQSAVNLIDPLQGAKAFAADVDIDTSVGLPDAGMVQQAAVNLIDPISTNPWA